MIPTLIVSGFLGSGKTSLVRCLLKEARRVGKRVAVISNEFGALGIDQAVLGAGGEAFVELDGGCVCCQLSNELVGTLEMLRRTVNPDQIVIETSGVALPGETQMNLWREPVKSWIADDVAVVVVNAEQVLEERDLEGTFEYQLTSADLLVLNKIDLVPDGVLPAIETRLRDIEPEAPIVHSNHGQVDPAVLFPPDPERLRRQRRMAAARRWRMGTSTSSRRSSRSRPASTRLRWSSASARSAPCAPRASFTLLRGCGCCKQWATGCSSTAVSQRRKLHCSAR